MKIKLDKSLTLADQVKTATEKMKGFKVRYTDGDLRRAFEDATDYNVYGDILRCDVQAFPTSWYSVDNMSYRVEMVVECTIDIKRFSFFCDDDLNVNMESGLINYKMFQ